MITSDKLDKPNWLTTVFELQGSVVLTILPRILFFAGFTAMLIGLELSDLPLYFEKLGDLTTNVIYNLILGLLVVFRTNTSYDRFWEGRKAWGALVANIRTLAQLLCLAVMTPTPETIAARDQALKLLPALAIATKLHLRGEALSDELRALVTPDQAEKLVSSKNRPLDICFWLRQYLQQANDDGQLSESMLNAAHDRLNQLMEGVSGCERILTTPIPITYRVYLKRLSLIYCIGLPFRVVPDLTWWALPIIVVVSFLLLGIEEVARELENPFGYDVNDIPIDDLCITIQNNVEQITNLNQTTTDKPVAIV